MRKDQVDFKTYNEEPSMTIQSAKGQCDINMMMKKYQRAGALPAARADAVYGDFSNVKDFVDARQALDDAQAAFNSLGSAVRKRFENDPAQLLLFLAEEGNRDEAIELGILEKPDLPPAVKGEVNTEVNPPQNAG